MNGPRPTPARLGLVVALGLGAALLAAPGCQPQSEGRPAGSIEVKTGRSATAEIEKAKAKAQMPPRGR